MGVRTMTMSRTEAVKKAAAYRRAMLRSKDPALAAAEAGYSAMAEGRTLLDLGLAIGAGGWTPEGYPRFAVARHDRKVVRFHRDGTYLVFDATSQQGQALAVGRLGKGIL